MIFFIIKRIKKFFNPNPFSKETMKAIAEYLEQSHEFKIFLENLREKADSKID